LSFSSLFYRRRWRRLRYGLAALPVVRKLDLHGIESYRFFAGGGGGGGGGATGTGCPSWIGGLDGGGVGRGGGFAINFISFSREAAAVAWERAVQTLYAPEAEAAAGAVSVYQPYLTTLVILD